MRSTAPNINIHYNSLQLIYDQHMFFFVLTLNIRTIFIANKYSVTTLKFFYDFYGQFYDFLMTSYHQQLKY